MSIEKILKNETRGVRDWFDRLAKSIADDEKARGLVRVLNEARERQDAARKAADGLAKMITRQQEAASGTQKEIDDLRASRPERVADALIQCGGFSEDDLLLKTIGELERDIERVGLAIPVFETRLQAAQRSLELAGRAVIDAQLELDGYRDSLRLAEARRRAAA